MRGSLDCGVVCVGDVRAETLQLTGWEADPSKLRSCSEPALNDTARVDQGRSNVIRDATTFDQQRDLARMEADGGQAPDVQPNEVCEQRNRPNLGRAIAEELDRPGELSKAGLALELIRVKLLDDRRNVVL
jgi:hypothetical protein